VLLYADTITGSLKAAIDETNRRRAIQMDYNEKNGITPKSISKRIKDITEELQSVHDKTLKEMLLIDKKAFEKNPERVIKQKEKQMMEAVKELDFETAALLRDEIKLLRGEPIGPQGERRKRK
jgi:excinuclease ABC subunit B